ncbi:OmpA family protein [Sphingobacterium sp. 1.A.4]|uniref:OmpA family protein n=1 Tax=Sphingobacterium sp. 1.A.4 TaxID=2044603 RepID=UPI000C0BBEBF|nr:OmpA family protein [Sphingobacterium sp. 1.A.4]
MENRLLNAARSLFDGDTINGLAQREGLTSEQVNKGLDASLPALFLGLQQQPEGALQGILDKFKGMFTGTNEPGQDITVPIDRPDSGFGNETQGLIGQLFGGKLDLVLEKLSGFLGMNGGSVMNLLKAAVPSVISALTMNGVNWNASRISSDLNENKAGFLSALPAGLSLGLFGDGISRTEPIVDPVKDVLVEEPVVPVRERVEPVTPVRNINEPVVVEEERKRGGGLWWLLIPLLLLALWFLFGKNFRNDDKAATTDTTVVVNPVEPDTITTTVPARESIMVTLPDGSTLNAYKGGIEDQLVQFLTAGYSTMSDDDLKNRWFDFDNLNFETGTSTIVPESQDQVNNIAAILKAFPDTKIKIGGYTDKTGDEDLNKKLSNDRAVAVKNALDAKGVGAQVIETEGYGSEFAKYDASAPESDRILDRRVSVSVRK